MSGTRGKAATAVAVFLVVAALTGVALISLPGFLWLLMESTSPFAVIGLFLLPIVLAVVVGWLAAIRVFRRLSVPAREAGASRAVLAWLLAAYVAGFIATWVLGAPAVQTELVGKGMAAYHRLASDPDREREGYPWFRFGASFPLAPGVVATYFECEPVALGGWGGWTLHLWYPGGTKQVAEWMLWLS